MKAQIIYNRDYGLCRCNGTGVAHDLFWHRPIIELEATIYAGQADISPMRCFLNIAFSHSIYLKIITRNRIN